MSRFERNRYNRKLYFTKAETENFADAAAAVGMVSAAIPEPVISKAVAAYAGGVSLLARRAVRQGRSLGLMWMNLMPGPPGVVPIPFFHDEIE
ncbi:hypothetical protein [Streptomyces sp. NPDC055056]